MPFVCLGKVTQPRVLDLAGRALLAALFLGGAVQKIADPAPVSDLLRGLGLPALLVWPLAAFNALAAVALFLPGVARRAALLLALYCMATSLVHWHLRADPWQVTIMVKNWAIAGGLLLLAARPLPPGGDVPPKPVERAAPPARLAQTCATPESAPCQSAKKAPAQWPGQVGR